MKPISQKHYMPTPTPYPAHIFTYSHPLRVSGPSDLRELFKRQRTTGDTVPVIEYQKSNLEAVK